MSGDRVRLWRVACAGVMSLALVGLAGCGGNANNPKAGGRSAIPDPTPETWIQRPGVEGSTAVSVHDACSNHLHDMIGSFLQYHLMHKRFPQRLDDLKAVGADVSPKALSCPDSGAAYVYVPDGAIIDGRAMVLLLYDAQPAHKGLRQGIAVQDSRPGSLVLKVVHITQAEFNLIRPAE
jgi:hypothetical protein